jgi:YebC/PmpR family DNA-binding regulatory protein
MAGHSHGANIAIKKGAADKKCGKLFGKLSRLIIVAARRGGPDVAMNLALRYAIDKAKKASMPKDNIERAVKRGCGETGGADFEELSYEGYGPNGVAVLCDILTDNRNRTAGEVRKTFGLHGGNLGATGCVSWMFERKGLLTVPVTSIEEEKLLKSLWKSVPTTSHMKASSSKRPVRWMPFRMFQRLWKRPASTRTFPTSPESRLRLSNWTPAAESEFCG